MHMCVCCRYLRNLPSTFKEADLSQLFAPFDGVKVRSQLLPIADRIGIATMHCGTTQHSRSASQSALDRR